MNFFWIISYSGVVLLGLQKLWGFSRIWKLRGHLFRSGHLIFSRGVWFFCRKCTVLDFMSTYHISKFFAYGGLLFFVFAYLISQLSKIFHLQRAFNQLLVIIVVNNFRYRPLFMDIRGLVKFFSRGGGVPKIEIQGHLLSSGHHKNSGGLRPSS